MVDHSSQNADKLLAVLVVTLIFSVMNGTMFNVALPEIGKEFNLVPSEVSWIMTSYMEWRSTAAPFPGPVCIMSPLLRVWS